MTRRTSIMEEYIIHSTIIAVKIRNIGFQTKKLDKSRTKKSVYTANRKTLNIAPKGPRKGRSERTIRTTDITQAYWSLLQTTQRKLREKLIREPDHVCQILPIKEPLRLF